jgi:serine/threonine protein kinase
MDDVTTIAHEAAYKRCGILHCDISPSNILISENDDGGLLIDWDLCKNVNSTEHNARRTVRIGCLLICTAVLMNWNQGTWQFMAADLVSDPGISQTFVHDLESAFYVMYWLSLKYLPSSYPPSIRGQILAEVFNPPPIDSPLSPSSNHGSLDSCGNGSKANWMANSGIINHYRFTGNDPLSLLLSSLKDMLGLRHVNSAIIKAIFDKVKPMLDSSKEFSDIVREEFSNDVEYSRVLEEFEKALQEEWPRDDSAQLQEIILPSRYQMAAIYGSKRSRTSMSESHNSLLIHSKPVRSSSSKRQKK